MRSNREEPMGSWSRPYSDSLMKYRAVARSLNFGCSKKIYTTTRGAGDFRNNSIQFFPTHQLRCTRKVEGRCKKSVATRCSESTIKTEKCGHRHVTWCNSTIKKGCQFSRRQQAEFVSSREDCHCQLHGVKWIERYFIWSYAWSVTVCVHSQSKTKQLTEIGKLYSSRIWQTGIAVKSTMHYRETM